MEPNQISTEPSKAEPQPNQITNQAPASEVHKSPKAPWAVAVVASIVAIAGIAFGIYGIMKPTEAPATDNLKVQIKNTDGTTTTLETDKIEKKEGSNVITIIDTPISSKTSNPIITKTLEEDDYTAKYTMSKSFHMYDYDTGANRKLNIDVADGEIEKCELIDPADQIKGDLLIDNCIINGLSKKIYKISTFAHGQTGNPPVVFILEDGTIEYFKLDDAIQSTTLTVKKANTNGFVVDVIDELGVFTNSKDGTSPSGGVTTAIIYSDGTFDYYDPETMLSE